MNESPPQISDTRMLPRLLRIALPSMAEQALVMLVTWIDLMLASRYLREDKFLAAMNQVNYLLWLLPSLFTFVGIGATAVIARHVGAKDREGAQCVLHQAFLIGLGIVAIVGSIWFFAGADLLTHVQLKPETTELVVEFVSIVVLVVPFIMLEQVGNACLRGSGDTVTGLVAMALVNIVDVCVGYCLLTGYGPFPNLGWKGIAIGTAAGYTVGGLVIAAALCRGRVGLKFELKRFKPQEAMIQRILRIGVPGGFDIMALIACQLWFVRIINRLGDTAAAAHGVAIRIEALAYLPGTALQIAATTLAGQYLGAKEAHNARRSALVALFWSNLLMCSVGAIFFFMSHSLVELFLGSERANLVTTAAPLIETIALAMPALAAIQIFTGTLRGSGDTRIPILATFFGFLVVRIPLTLLLTSPAKQTVFFENLHGWEIGIQGAWCAMVTDLYLRSIPLAVRFFQGGWQRVKV